MHTLSNRRFTVALLIAGALAMGSAFADEREGMDGGKRGQGAKKWQQGGGRGEAHRMAERRDDRRDQTRREGHGVTRGGFFVDDHRAAVRGYYDPRFRSGRCPPGLAKKHNGCMPPGQARKWHLGHPLPRDVVYYDLPPQLVVTLGPPPAGHRFVRVAGDILLIAIGTGLVIDAIEDISR